MRHLAAIAVLALVAGCASTPQPSAGAKSAARPKPPVEQPAAPAPTESAPTKLDALRQLSVETASHLEEAQPGELGMSMTPHKAPPPERAESPRAAAHPKLVSKRSRPQLFVLPTRSAD